MIQVRFKRQNERQKAERVIHIAISLAFKPAGILVFCSWLSNPGGIAVSKSFKRPAACPCHCGGCVVARAAVEQCLSPATA